MKLKIEYYIITGLVVFIVGLLVFWPQKESKFQVERERLSDSVKVQTKRVQILQKDTTNLNRENKRLEAMLVLRQAELSKIRESARKAKQEAKKGRSFTDDQHDSTFQKIFPVPDSILFSKGSKATYIVHVQKQVHEGLIQLDYAHQMILAMDSTLNLFESLVVQKNAIIDNQNKTITGLHNLNETLLKSQVNDLGEISKLRKKKRFAGFVIKVGIPVAFGAGLWLGLK